MAEDALSEKQIQALDAIDTCKASLWRIKEKSFNHARLERWRMDTGRLLAQTISRREADNFLNKKVPGGGNLGLEPPLLSLELSAYATDRAQFLDALAERIHEDPKFYFVDAVELDLRREVSPDADAVYIMYGDLTEALKLDKMLTEYKINAKRIGDHPKGSLTLIQMMEDSCHDFAFVFVILTNDEEAKDKKGKIEHRSRPNALIELGYYLGRFGQERVAVLCTREIQKERPSDIGGCFVDPFIESVTECEGFILKQLGTVGLGPKAAKFL